MIASLFETLNDSSRDKTNGGADRTSEESEEEKQEEQDIMQWLTHRQPPRMRDIHWEHPHTVDWNGNTLAAALVHTSHTETS